MREYVWLECTDVRRTQLSRAERNPGRQPPRAQEVLSARAEAYAAQGIAQEIVSAGGRRSPRVSAVSSCPFHSESKACKLDLLSREIRA